MQLLVFLFFYSATFYNFIDVHCVFAIQYVELTSDICFLNSSFTNFSQFRTTFHIFQHFQHFFIILCFQHCFYIVSRGAFWSSLVFLVLVCVLFFWFWSSFCVFFFFWFDIILVFSCVFDCFCVFNSGLVYACMCICYVL